METKGKGNDKDSKDDEAFKEGVEDIMEDGDVLSNDRDLPHIDKKVYPSKGKNYSIRLPNWTLESEVKIMNLDIVPTSLRLSVSTPD